MLQSISMKSVHFLDILTITKLEHVPGKVPDTFMGHLDRDHIFALRQREQYWKKY